MGVSGGPNVVTDGLVLDLDAANAQSYPNYYNLLRYSQQFNSWTQDSCTVGADAITAPDGTLTADSFTELAVNAQHLATQNISWISGSTYTFSTYAKAGNQNTLCLVMSYTAFGAAWRTAYFDLSAGTVSSNNNNSGVSPTITSVGNGWYRCTFTCTCTTSVVDKLAAGKDFYGHLGDGQINLYLWGAQLELGTQASSYQQIDASYTTNWSDLSPTVTSGSLTNGTYYNIYSTPPKAMYFDGTDDYIGLGTPSPLNITGNITVNSWVNLSSFPTVGNVGVIYEKGYDNSNEQTFLRFRNVSSVLFLDAGTYRSSNNTTYSVAYNIGSTITTGSWNNIVGQYDGANWNIYLNGILASSSLQNQSPIASSSPSSIGAAYISNGYARFLKGNIGLVQIYNRALSADEVLQNYNATKGRFGL